MVPWLFVDLKILMRLCRILMNIEDASAIMFREWSIKVVYPTAMSTLRSPTANVVI